MRLLLIGFGHVGQRLAEILISRAEAPPTLKSAGISVVGIATRSHGCLVNPAGIDIRAALQASAGSRGFPRHMADFAELDSLTAATELDYDVLVELSTLSISGKGEPALSHIREALRRGKHCVSANKGPVAFSYRELAALAKQNGARFLFESCVMDGAPVFNMARAAFRGCRVLAIRGIVNSTTNYVLSEMESGRTFGHALAEAQRRGFAEADPSLDLQGWDAAAKLCVLANVLMGGTLEPSMIGRVPLTEEIFLENRPRTPSERLKLVVRAEEGQGMVRAWMELQSLPADDPLARVSGPGSALLIETDLMGPILIQQMAPTLSDTAYGVLNDLLEIAEHSA